MPNPSDNGQVFSGSQNPALPHDQTGAPGVKRERIIPWKKFLSSLVPNWLLCRTEISQGAKLCYGRLAQYAGKDGECFPKQRTLARELGVSTRTAREYIRELEKFHLLESERPGLGMANRYFFLDHPWVEQWHSEHPGTSAQQGPVQPAQNRQESSALAEQPASGPITKEIQDKEIKKKENPGTPGKDFGLNSPSVGTRKAKRQTLWELTQRREALERLLKNHPGKDVWHNPSREDYAECHSFQRELESIDRLMALWRPDAAADG